MRRFTAFGAILGLALALATPAAAAGSCRFVQTRELQVEMEGTVPTVAAKVNGADVRFIVDSGAFYSTLKTSAAERVGVKHQPGDPYDIVGVDGTVSARSGRARELQLAGRTYKDFWFVLSDIGLPPRFDGLLGENVLGFKDTEYDLADGAVRSFSAEGCAGQLLAYWVKPTQAYGVIDIEPLRVADAARAGIIGRVYINGQPVRAQFDTGAAHSMMTLETARRLGIDLGGKGVTAADATSGIASLAMETKSIPVASFQIDQEVIHNTRVEMARSEMSADMLIGADFFLAHRVLVAPSQNKLYFTYNGGPVFQLEEPTGLVSAKAGEPVAERAVLTDADALERRALASFARGDGAGAAADLDKAIGLEPKRARLYYDRAKVRAEADQAELAAADAEAAIKFDPAYVDALLLRGHLLLKAKQREQAEASFAAAMKAAPADRDVRWYIAESYQSADLFEPALANMDAWMAAHPKENLAAAYNSRCWTRALWGRELDKALADCNEAMKRGLRLAEVLDSRGLVHYRRGEFRDAISDYDAALKAQPNLAWSRLGRGLARLKTGDLAGGRADIAAAEALQPGIRQKAEGYGLAVPADAGVMSTS